ncbi:MAG: SGNH/GDSL hydrolase family protein, partial [Bacteroidaceae bacterium]|nr:SGNH/GDSL hydrolase family protein [Bacteroidaceae bacterium]
MRAYLKIIAILLLPLAFIIFYAYSPVQIPPPGWKLSKIQTFTLSPSSTTSNSPMKEEDTVILKEEKKESLPDSSSHHILFFGDSMVEGLLRRMNSYAFANGYEMTNVVWYSSTTEIWAQTDTLHYFINKVKPTFVMISLGANEQFIKNAAGRETCIRRILQELGNTPYVWIGVPGWREDTGINDLTRQIVGKDHYFDSRGLTLQRGSDHMHPTFHASALWM